MAQISVVVCDVCRSPDDTKHYTIQDEGGVYEMDLCEAHRKPLEALKDKLGPVIPTPARKPAKRAAQARRTPLTKVTSMDEIEALRKGK